MTVAVCLLTCDRPEYTASTLGSFCGYNDRSRFVLLHGDDSSVAPDNGKLAESAGFETVVQHTRRQGAQATRRELVNVAAARGADWVLMLENDWQSVRSFPWALLEHIDGLRGIYCLRLYGAFKEKGNQRPCYTNHLGLSGHPGVVWAPLVDAPEPAEVGLIHYGSPPNVTRIADAQWLHEGTHSDRQAGEKSGRIKRLTARVIENVFYHIGQERTPSFAA